jgi:hypothetical protein
MLLLGMCATLVTATELIVEAMPKRIIAIDRR